MEKVLLHPSTSTPPPKSLPNIHFEHKGLSSNIWDPFCSGGSHPSCVFNEGFRASSVIGERCALYYFTGSVFRPEDKHTLFVQSSQHLLHTCPWDGRSECVRVCVPFVFVFFQHGRLLRGSFTQWVTAWSFNKRTLFKPQTEKMSSTSPFSSQKKTCSWRHACGITGVSAGGFQICYFAFMMLLGLKMFFGYLNPRASYESYIR